MLIGHIGLTVGDYDESKQFFCPALAPLGIELIVEVEGWTGLGNVAKPEFWPPSLPGEPTMVLREFRPFAAIDIGRAQGTLDAAYRWRVPSPPRAMRL
jgi:hypothetical protein